MLPSPPTETASPEARTAMRGEQFVNEVDEKSNPTRDEPDIELVEATGATPVSAKSKIELVAMLRAWIDSHPTLRIPELARYDRNAFESNFAVEASIVETGERIWVIRLGVLDMYQGWVIDRPDGSNLLVKAKYRKSGYEYYPWLGHNLGYSDEAIAHHKDVPRQVISLRQYSQKRALDAEDVLNAYDISRAALEFEEAPLKTRGLAKVIKDSQESNTSLSSSPADPELRAIQCAGQKGADARGKKRDSSGRYRKGYYKSIANSTEHPERSKFGFTPSKRRRLLSLPRPPPSEFTVIRTLEEIEDLQLRSKVDRMHTLLQIKTVGDCYCALIKKNGNFEDAVRYLSASDRQPTSTIFSRAADTSLNATPPRPSKLLPNRDLPKTPSPGRFNGPNLVGLATPFASTRSTTPVAYLTPTPVFSPSHNTTTTFYLFLSNASMGAIPISFSKLTTRTKFFKEATAAYFLSSNAASNGDDIIAASVMISGMNRAIVVRKDKVGIEAWEEVGRVVRDMVKMGQGVEAEVRCIVGG
ncbi:MAG: hypothetical protein Q9166_006048 [cf. Caloplaca sp. 2 TL-2023]